MSWMEYGHGGGEYYLGGDRSNYGCQYYVDPVWILVNMKTSWHGDTFRMTGPLWGKSTVQVDSPHKKSVMRTFGILIVANLYKLLYI